MNFETVDAEKFGKSLKGIGLNLLVRNVRAHCTMLETVFDMAVHQPTDDFAIVTYGDQVFQLHADGTYHSNPLLGLLPENGARGAGLEIRLFDTDPEVAFVRAEAAGMHVLQPPTDKPHGLREAYLLCPDGYAWVPSRPKD
ncbi:glyoxalase [Shimia thalassica]|uniref:VOC family protein n=1 Tax=Shimia thalassica TaxID=1715693 RepID=UPI001C09388C|nr:glyoxalase [Shimia thalassica]MBU2944877.1 glyoxalase [Shimia thalassica]MDO6504817.1 glyoxalase [Shimia thalassica]